MIPQIQITQQCNLACNYCFQDHEAAAIIDSRTINNFIDKYAAYMEKVAPAQKELEVLWHGGEPLLGGLEVFRQIVAAEARHPDITFDNRLQTNGVALTEKMARFLVEKKFHLGFSLDGPEDIQNRHRVLKGSGAGSFQAVMQGIRNYKKYSPYPYVSVIAVVSNYTVHQGAKRFYNFFKDLGACLQFQPYDLTSADLLNGNFNSRTHEIMPDQEEYAQFVIDLFDLWFYDDPDKILITDLKDEIKKVLIGQGIYQNILAKKRCLPQRTIIDPRGRVFSCDMYINRDQTSLGNINTDSLEEMLSRKYALWEKIKENFRDANSHRCLGCAYGETCTGGCLTCMKYNYLLLKGYSLQNPEQIKEVNDFFSAQFPDCGDAYFCRAFRIYRRHIYDKVTAEMTEDNYLLRQTIKAIRA